MDLMEARAQFAADAAPYKKEILSSQNSFGAFFSNNNDYVLIGKWVCHGWLQDHHIDSHSGRSHYSSGIKYVMSAVMKPRTDSDHLKTYVDWLINQSPYQHIFVDKDPDSVMKYGYLVDADNCPSFITSAMIASRFLTESYLGGASVLQRAQTHKELLNLGLSGTEAFVFAQMFSSEKAGHIYPITFNPFCSGHSVFHSTAYQEDYVRNFLSGNPVGLTSFRLSKREGYSGGIHDMWGKPDRKDRNTFLDWVKGRVPIRKALKTDHNIFRKAPQSGWSYTNGEDFLSVIEQVKERLNA